MKLKQLECVLSRVAGFEEPKWALEQYSTPVHFASRMIQVAADAGHIEDCAVLDLGCGTGMLLTAASLLGAGSVTGVDADGDALVVARRNVDMVLGDHEDAAEPDLIQADVGKLDEVLRCSGGGGGGGERGDGGSGQCCSYLFDTVVMNPPFGTKKQGADMIFLDKALKVAPVVYSLHKTSTREFIVSKAAPSYGAVAEVLAELRYDLPATYKFHKKKSVTIEVDLIRFAKEEEEEEEEEEDG